MLSDVHHAHLKHMVRKRAVAAAASASGSTSAAVALAGETTDETTGETSSEVTTSASRSRSSSVSSAVASDSVGESSSAASQSEQASSSVETSTSPSSTSASSTPSTSIASSSAAESSSTPARSSVASSSAASSEASSSVSSALSAESSTASSTDVSSSARSSSSTSTHTSATSTSSSSSSSASLSTSSSTSSTHTTTTTESSSLTSSSTVTSSSSETSSSSSAAPVTSSTTSAQSSIAITSTTTDLAGSVVVITSYAQTTLMTSSDAVSASSGVAAAGAAADHSASVSSGGIAGAVIGAIAGVIALVALVWFFLRRRSRKYDIDDDKFNKDEFKHQSFVIRDDSDFDQDVPNHLRDLTGTGPLSPNSTGLPASTVASMTRNNAIHAMNPTGFATYNDSLGRSNTLASSYSAPYIDPMLVRSNTLGSQGPFADAAHLNRANTLRSDYSGGQGSVAYGTAYGDPAAAGAYGTFDQAHYGTYANSDNHNAYAEPNVYTDPLGRSNTLGSSYSSQYAEGVHRSQTMTSNGSNHYTVERSNTMGSAYTNSPILPPSYMSYDGHMPQMENLTTSPRMMSIREEQRSSPPKPSTASSHGTHSSGSISSPLRQRQNISPHQYEFEHRDDAPRKLTVTNADPESEDEEDAYGGVN